MCGIVGFFSEARPISGELLARATGALHHRGPDGQRQWVSPSGRVGLGHARLAIVDLHTGEQPIANEDGQVRVVVNGEFYDFERIRADLEGRGHHLRTRSDSEVVVHLYEEYGAQCVNHLRGEFAFLLWDERRQRLLAGRDRFGIKPLFYAELDGMLAFGSEVKALVAAGLGARWDEETFAQLTCLAGSGPDRSSAGIPKKSFWTGTKRAETAPIPTGVFRCAACGFLESYARDEFAATWTVSPATGGRGSGLVTRRTSGERRC